MVILKNGSHEKFKIDPYDRIAQLVLSKVPKAEFVEVTEFSKATERGANGFGSTGVK